MKKTVLLFGKQLMAVPEPHEIEIGDINLYVSHSLERVEEVFAITGNNVDLVIIGGGLPLETRLQVVKYVFDTSDTTSVHMKDIVTGPEGYLPFVNGVLRGLVNH